jgi:hypothetical protein
MTQSNAFDQAVAGVEGIIHTASPVTTVADDPEGTSAVILANISEY